MISTVVTLDATNWTITGDDQPNPLAPTPRIIATINGVDVDLDCQYQQITSVVHGDGCTWGVNLSPICTCAPRPTDPTALFDAARDILRRCFDARILADTAAREARDAAADSDEVWVTVPRGCEGCPSAIFGGVCTCC